MQRPLVNRSAQWASPQTQSAVGQPWYFQSEWPNTRGPTKNFNSSKLNRSPYRVDNVEFCAPNCDFFEEPFLGVLSPRAEEVLSHWPFQDIEWSAKLVKRCKSVVDQHIPWCEPSQWAQVARVGLLERSRDPQTVGREVCGRPDFGLVWWRVVHLLTC